MYDACVPKGLELEVGARRAPKLLVYVYNKKAKTPKLCKREAKVLIFLESLKYN